MSYAEKIFGEQYFINSVFNSDKGLHFLSKRVKRPIVKADQVGKLAYVNLKPEDDPDSETEVYRVDISVKTSTAKGGADKRDISSVVKHHPKIFLGNSEQSLDFNEFHALDGFLRYFKDHPDDPIESWAVPVLLHHRAEYSTVVREYVQGTTLEDRLLFIDLRMKQLTDKLGDPNIGDVAADDINKKLKVLQLNRERYTLAPMKFLMRLLHIMNNNPKYFKTLHENLRREYDKPLEERYAEKLGDYISSIVPEQASGNGDFKKRLERLTANFIESLPYKALKLSEKRIVTRDYHAKNIVLAGETLEDQSIVELPVREEEILGRLCFFDWGKVGIGVLEGELADYMNSPALKYGEMEIKKGLLEAMTVESILENKKQDPASEYKFEAMFRLIEPLRILRVAAKDREMRKDPALRMRYLKRLQSKYAVVDPEARSFLDGIAEFVPEIRPS